MIHSGRIIQGRPTIGSWVTYGLGNENQSLPAYVVLDDPLGLPVNGVQNWQAGFLPPIYQGTRIRAEGSPILNLHPEVEESPLAVEVGRELLGKLDNIHKRSRPGQLQLDARIASYELAARLQIEASDALDLTQETPKTLEMYGVGAEPTDSYARRCLMARRLVERGVRYVQLFINGQIWDNHSKLEGDLRKACERTDQPVSALLSDLKQRGLLDETLVIWGGEFGRMPIAQLAEKSAAGRDHNPHAFTTWMAGAGIKAGTVLGSTDDLGYKAVEDRVSVTDWHATILHLLGLDYERLVFDQKRAAGKTDVRLRSAHRQRNPRLSLWGARFQPCRVTSPRHPEQFNSDQPLHATQRDCGVILSEVTRLAVRRARRLLRVRPGPRPRRQLRGAPGIRMQGTSSRPCEPSTDRRSPPTCAHPTRPHALRTPRS